VLLGGFLRAGKTAEKLLDPRSGAIGSFAARADLCYCLDLISKDMYQDLITIAEIRNQLAHNYFSLSFSTESVAELCGKLRYVKSLRLPNANNTAALEGVLKDARGIFVMSVVLLSRDLLIKSREVRQQDV
jgi:DNA-binding MltR family transcriptional regulator